MSSPAMCLSIVAVVVLCVALPWIRSVWQPEPWFYGAIRCLRGRAKPGESGFWTRLMFKPALIRQTAGSDGRLTRIVVILPHWRKPLLEKTLVSLAKDPTAWPDKKGRYVIDCRSHLRGEPGLTSIDTWGEYHPDWGVRFVSERAAGLAAVPDMADSE